jgi:putative SOS response-associated peptidase YedK
LSRQVDQIAESAALEAMCSRFETDRKKVEPRFDIDPDSEIAQAATWGEVRPTDPALLIAADDEPIVRRWGLMPEWAERPIINAKAEDAAHKKTFQPMLASRCIIPAAGWYEWRPDAGRKIKTHIGHGEILLIAGLYDAARFVMFTCAAAPGVAHVHHRMPALLSDAQMADWLDPGARFDEVRHLLTPSPLDLTVAEATPPVAPARRVPVQHSLF